MASFFCLTFGTLSALSPLLLLQVVCRVRPPVSRETHGAKTLSLANRCVVVADDKRTVTLNSKPQEKNFTFDYAAGEDSTQEELFAEVRFPGIFSAVFMRNRCRSCMLENLTGVELQMRSEGTAQHNGFFLFLVLL